MQKTFGCSVPWHAVTISWIADIDFLVDFQPGSTLFDQDGLIDALSSKLGRKVDVVSARALNRHLSKNILTEAVTL